ncbi:glycosyltransferase, partial [Microbacterium sp. ISL-103]|nr:glycosyltransferase [Microbacterium sp. ISL-103]
GLGGGWWAGPGGAGTGEQRTAGLSDTLRRAASDIAAGTAPVPVREVSEAFRQSSRTAAMIEVYERVLAD